MYTHIYMHFTYMYVRTCTFAHTCIYTDTGTDRQTDTHTYTDTGTNRQTDRHTHTYIHRQTLAQTDRQTHIHTDTGTNRQTYRLGGNHHQFAIASPTTGNCMQSPNKEYIHITCTHTTVQAECINIVHNIYYMYYIYSHPTGLLPNDNSLNVAL